MSITRFRAGYATLNTSFYLTDKEKHLNVDYVMNESYII